VPAPVVLWQSIVIPQLTEIINDPETEKKGSARGILFQTGEYQLEYGRRKPVCRDCHTPWDPGILVAEALGGNPVHVCSGCGKGIPLRKPPDWLSEVFPPIRALIDEDPSGLSDHDLTGDRGISIFCYHCGAALPLDGSSRTAECRYCGNGCMVPDDIWLRLHPVHQAKPWDIVIDLGEGVGILPDSIDTFIDLAGLAGNDSALLWEDDSGFCLGRTDRYGILRWVARGFHCDNHARLFYVQANDCLWIIDPEVTGDSVLVFEASTGKRIFAAGKDPKNRGERIVPRDFESAAVCSDNTVVLYRRWGDGPDNEKPVVIKRRLFGPPRRLTRQDLDRLNARTGLWELRRFHGGGLRVPLWDTLDTSLLIHTVPTWDTLTDCPLQPPDNALLEGGPDGTLYMVDAGGTRVARFDRNGRLLCLVNVERNPVEEVEDCGVAPDGSVIILFNHKKKIGTDTWSHVARIGLDGQFTLLAGPWSGGYPFSFGQWVERISVSPDGAMHMCDSDFDSLRVLLPDGSLLWRSPGAISGGDARLAETLAEAGK
jgi:hypothetical protein